MGWVRRYVAFHDRRHPEAMEAPEVSAFLSHPLQAHLAAVRRRHEADLMEGAGHVELPGALRARYPNASREWTWQWVFPVTRRYVDEATGEQRRHHIHETALQRSLFA